MGVYGKEAAKEMADRHKEQAQGKFIRLKNDGDKVTGAFLGDPYSREIVWVNEQGEVVGFGYKGKTKPEEYDEAKHGDPKTAKPRMMTAWNLFDEEKEEVRVLDLGVGFFRTWVQADDKYGRAWTFEIKRHGAKGDENTTYSCFPDRQLTEEEIGALEKLDLYDLSDSSDSLGDDSSSGSKTVDAEVANKLIADLKELRDSGHPDILKGFLTAFGVEAIRDVPADKGEQALAYVRDQKQKLAKSEKPTERDPFA
jgi:hypothetical protein